MTSQPEGFATVKKHTSYSTTFYRKSKKKQDWNERNDKILPIKKYSAI